MSKVKVFDNQSEELISHLIGKEIANIDYSINVPIEYNCIKILFTDNSELLVYSIFRVIENQKIVLCDSDYYLDEELEKKMDVNNIEESLLGKTLLYANEKIRNQKIKKAFFNEWGDLTLEVNDILKIEIFIDSTENEMDYLIYYENKYYNHLCRMNNQTIVISGEI